MQELLLVWNAMGEVWRALQKVLVCGVCRWGEG